MGEAVVRVLEACGCRVVFPLDQHCCGLVAANMGDRPRARVMARQTIQMLEATEADWFVTNSTSCLAAVAQDYQHLFRADPEWRERAARQAERLIDFTTFLDRVAALEPQRWVRPGPRVTYHDACQSHNALGIRAAPRRLLTEVLDCELVEMRESSVCCGFGGSFSVDYPQLSSAILARKLDNAAQTGAELIVTDNPGCLMQIRGGLHARGSTVRAVHLAELIAERLGELVEAGSTVEGSAPARGGSPN
jgi:Fe-S oxidoreductase